VINIYEFQDSSTLLKIVTDGM